MMKSRCGWGSQAQKLMSSIHWQMSTFFTFFIGSVFLNREKKLCNTYAVTIGHHEFIYDNFIITIRFTKNEKKREHFVYVYFFNCSFHRFFTFGFVCMVAGFDFLFDSPVDSYVSIYFSRPSQFFVPFFILFGVFVCYSFCCVVPFYFDRLPWACRICCLTYIFLMC